MSRNKYFTVRVGDKTYRLSLDGGMKLVQRMDANPYDLSDYELQCAQRFENFFLGLKRQSEQRWWGVVGPPA